MPKGFNPKQPLDKIMLELGEHIFKRSESIKLNRKQSQTVSTTKNPNSDDNINS